MNDLHPLRIFVTEGTPSLQKSRPSTRTVRSADITQIACRRPVNGSVDGLALRQELQNINELRATKIMFIPSRSGELWKERSIEAGAGGYIAKPIDAVTLVQTIELIVRRGAS
jgi:CheY-like chemotaxis protein